MELSIEEEGGMFQLMDGRIVHDTFKSKGEAVAEKEKLEVVMKAAEQIEERVELAIQCVLDELTAKQVMEVSVYMGGEINVAI